MAIQSIDTHQFLVITGQLGSVQNRPQVITRPGVDGELIRRLGKRGTDFTVNTVTDVLDLITGRTLFRDYETLVAQDAVDMVWNGFGTSAQESRKVFVLAVGQRQLSYTPTRAGKFNSSSLWTLRATWVLKLVDE